MPKSPSYLTGKSISALVATAASMLSEITDSTVIADILLDSATIYPRTATDDGEGNIDMVEGTPVTAVPCRINRASSMGEATRAGAARTTTLFDALFELGTDIAEHYRVECNGQRFEVIDTDQGTSDALFITAKLAKID